MSEHTAIEIREIGRGETALAHEAMKALRPAFADLAAFVERVDDVQRSEGYRLVGAFRSDEPNARAVSGFRFRHSLSWGRHLYVDDLSTSPSGRRQGLAGALLDWLVEEARRLGCEQLHLDSGVSENRYDAHRLYLNHGFAITAHHFARGV